MQRIKKQVVLAILMLLLGAVAFSNITNVYAWHNTTVQTKTLYCQRGGGPAAKMGTTTQYGFIGPAGERSPQFYSALIAKGGDDVCCWGFFYVRAVRIEVTGVDPNGNPLQGDRFGDLTVLVSPDDSGVEQETLVIVFKALVDVLPKGLKEILKNTITSGGATTHRDSEKAWAEWTWSAGVPVLSCREKGLRFGYELNVDSTLEGTYTINIHYSAIIWWSDHGGGYEGTIDLYETLEYDYVNTPPTPSKPSGPTSGYADTTYTYYTSTTDPNGDSLRYQFDWGDGTSTTTGWYASGATASASHYWTSTGTKYVKVRAQDSTGAWSGWSPSLTVTIVNRAPNTPSTPSGPTSGYTGISYSYSTSTTDPDGDNVRYQFDWGDGSTTTTGWYPSGSTASASHSWGSTGTYYVKVKAQDEYGEWSGWSSSLAVAIYAGGGGCPTLFVWDGSQYVEEATLDIHADSDVTLQHTIGQTLAPDKNFYKLSLRELDEFTSHIDYVKLYVVDSDGEMHETHLTKVVHSEFGDVKELLLHDDDTRVDLTPEQTIDLRFIVPDIDDVAYFMFEINGYNMKFP